MCLEENSSIKIAEYLIKPLLISIYSGIDRGLLFYERRFMSVINMLKASVESKVSVKKQAVGAAVAIIAAVMLPQLLHMAGRAVGVETSLGEILLPMHLPIILVGLLAGPYAGMVAGFLAPLCSFAFSGMPTALMLPIITAEVLTYGFCAGIIKNFKMSMLAKVFSVQIAGRIVRAIVTLLLIYAFGRTNIAVASIWNSVVTGLAGIAIQLVIIPFIVKRFSFED